MADIEKEVIDIIVEHLGVDPSEVTLQKSLVEDLSMDSLDQTEIIMELEKHFNIDVSEKEAEELRTVGQVVEYIRRRKNG